MKRIVKQLTDYRIVEVGIESYWKVAEFVVKQNYQHHVGNDFPTEIDDEIEEVYQEEILFAPTSKIFIAENGEGCMIGCIRVMQWNKVDELPMQKLFCVNPLDSIPEQSNVTLWHVGRFAVDSSLSRVGLSLFKQLMMYAIYPIYQQPNSYMLAECDNKLLRVMNLLGIQSVTLTKGVYYLGSETTPIYASKNGLTKFYSTYNSLYYNFSN